MNILVIRRDNIGDLVCTTPFLHALRKHYPEARIEVLVNSYNAPVLAGNPDVDAVHVYRKAKHRAEGESKWRVWWQTWRLTRRIRQAGVDLAILATPAPSRSALKYARAVGARRIIGYGSQDDGLSDGLPPPSTGVHEVEAVMALLQLLDQPSAPGALRVQPDAALCVSMTRVVPSGPGPLIGLHISARKPPQRWPEASFIALAGRLVREKQARLLLFWSPGREDDPLHPGDDDKAARIVVACRGLPLAPIKTKNLEELIAGLSVCDAVICSDGGAMHLAAGVGKPIVCLFGNSEVSRWRPWGVPQRVLQPHSCDVRDVTVDEVFKALEDLWNTSA